MGVFDEIFKKKEAKKTKGYNNTPTEYQEQVAVFDYCNAKGFTMVAVPNDSWANVKNDRDKRNIAININRKKSAGFRSGFPDFFVMNKHGGIIFIELKRTKGGVASEKQKAWIKTLNDIGQKAFICKGAKEAIEKIDKYL